MNINRCFFSKYHEKPSHLSMDVEMTIISLTLNVQKTSVQPNGRKQLWLFLATTSLGRHGGHLARLKQIQVFGWTSIENLSALSTWKVRMDASTWKTQERRLRATWTNVLVWLKIIEGPLLSTFRKRMNYSKF